MVVFVFAAFSLVVIISLHDDGFVVGDLTIQPQDTEVVVGNNIQLSCKTSDVYPVRWQHIPVGSRSAIDVYVSRTIVTPYHMRFSVGGDSANGEYHLVIKSVRPEDSGRYECIDKAGHGEVQGAELTILDSPPRCNSNINTDGMIGDNDCGREPEDIKITCSLKYSGRNGPDLEWKTTTDGNVIIPKSVKIKEGAGEVTYKAVIRPKQVVDGDSITCQTTLFKINWTSDAIKILYVFNTSTALQISQSSHENCAANSSQSCIYEWIEINSEETDSAKINTFGPLIDIRNPGKFICRAECYLRGQTCTVQPKTVEFIPNDNNTSGEFISSRSIVITLGVGLIAIVGWLSFVILAIVFDRHRKKHPKFSSSRTLFVPPISYRVETLRIGEVDGIAIQNDALIQGAAVLNDQLYVVRRGSDTVLVYQLQHYHRFIKQITETKIFDPRDIAACSTMKCLYITDAFRECVWKMDTDGNCTTWLTGIERRYTISVNKEGRVLLPQIPNKINIYDSDASPWKTITLADDIRDLQHAFQLSDDVYLVIHGENNDTNHEILMVSIEGKVLKRFGKESGHERDQLCHPRHIAVGNGRVFVADKGNNRIVVLDETLEFQHEIKHAEIIRQPIRLCYENGILFVGQYRTIHVIVNGFSDRTRNISQVSFSTNRLSADRSSSLPEQESLLISTRDSGSGSQAA